MARLIPTPSAPLQVRPRMAQLDDGRFVEPVAHPLFSSCYLAAGALPSEAVFFTTGIGDQLIGATAGVTCKRFHTNLDKGGILPAPKCFIAQGIRLFVHPQGWSAAGVPTMAEFTAGGAVFDVASNIDDHQDIISILGGSVLTLEHQDQMVVEEPAWLVPGNYYLDGHCQLNIGGVGGTVTNDTLTVAGTYSSKGIARSFGQFGRVINSQEAFVARLEWKMTRSAQSTTASGLNDGKLVTCILDGAMVRGVR